MSYQQSFVSGFMKRAQDQNVSQEVAVDLLHKLSAVIPGAVVPAGAGAKVMEFLSNLLKRKPATPPPVPGPTQLELPLPPTQAITGPFSPSSADRLAAAAAGAGIGLAGGGVGLLGQSIGTNLGTLAGSSPSNSYDVNAHKTDALKHLSSGRDAVAKANVKADKATGDAHSNMLMALGLGGGAGLGAGFIAGNNNKKKDEEDSVKVSSYKEGFLKSALSKGISKDAANSAFDNLNKAELHKKANIDAQLMQLLSSHPELAQLITGGQAVPAPTGGGGLADMYKGSVLPVAQ